MINAVLEALFKAGGGSKATFCITGEKTCFEPPQGYLNDNITEMWKRLDERYGDEGKVVKIVLNENIQFRPIKENEERRLLAFVDIIVKASMGLKYLGQEPDLKKNQYDIFNN